MEREEGWAETDTAGVVMRGIPIFLSQVASGVRSKRPDLDWNTVYEYLLRCFRQSGVTQLIAQMELPLKRSRRFLGATHAKVHRCACNPAGRKAWQASGASRMA
ncbi:MAG: hypothetical protein ABIQ44_10160 [Chloroflexia bacterium]